MGEIKSAWELAMERTAGIESDKSSLRIHELKKAGGRIASAFMDANSPDSKKMLKEIDSYPKDDRETLRKAVVEILLSYINLPRDEDFQKKIDFVTEGLKALLGKGAGVKEILPQVSQFFSQFLQHRRQITEQLKEQYTPQLRRKQQSLAKQYGYEVELKHEQDPEFNALLKRNLQQLEAQYQEALNQVKDQLRASI
jgi:hypothetical protein